MDKKTRTKKDHKGQAKQDAPPPAAVAVAQQNPKMLMDGDTDDEDRTVLAAFKAGLQQQQPPPPPPPSFLTSPALAVGHLLAASPAASADSLSPLPAAPPLSTEAAPAPLAADLAAVVSAPFPTSTAAQRAGAAPLGRLRFDPARKDAANRGAFWMWSAEAPFQSHTGTQLLRQHGFRYLWSESALSQMFAAIGEPSPATLALEDQEMLERQQRQNQPPPSQPLSQPALQQQRQQQQQQSSFEARSSSAQARPSSAFSSQPAAASAGAATFSCSLADAATPLWMRDVAYNRIVYVIDLWRRKGVTFVGTAGVKAPGAPLSFEALVVDDLELQARIAHTLATNVDHVIEIRNAAVIDPCREVMEQQRKSYSHAAAVTSKFSVLLVSDATQFELKALSGDAAKIPLVTRSRFPGLSQKDKTAGCQPLLCGTFAIVTRIEPVVCTAAAAAAKAEHQQNRASTRIIAPPSEPAQAFTRRMMTMSLCAPGQRLVCTWLESWPEIATAAPGSTVVLHGFELEPRSIEHTCTSAEVQLKAKWGHASCIGLVDLADGSDARRERSVSQPGAQE